LVWFGSRAYPGPLLTEEGRNWFKEQSSEKQSGLLENKFLKRLPFMMVIPNSA